MTLREAKQGNASPYALRLKPRRQSVPVPRRSWLCLGEKGPLTMPFAACPQERSRHTLHFSTSPHPHRSLCPFPTFAKVGGVHFFRCGALPGTACTFAKYLKWW